MYDLIPFDQLLHHGIAPSALSLRLNKYKF